MNEAQITAIVQELYGEAPKLRHYRTSINTIYRVQFTHSDDKIFKFCDNPRWKSGIRREQAILPTLKEHGLAVATVEYTQDDVQQQTSDFTIMPREAEYSLSELFATNPTEYSSLFADAGRWLARLHAIDPKPFPGLIKIGEAIVRGISERRELQQNLDKAGMMQQAYHPLLKRFEDLQKRPRRDLIHGDFHAGQVMVKDKQIAYVVDWDSAQYGRAMRDLGLCIAYTKFYDRAVLEAQMLHDAYEKVRPLRDADRHEALHWELYTLLRITAEAALSHDDNLVPWGKQLIQSVYMKVI